MRKSWTVATTAVLIAITGTISPSSPALAYPPTSPVMTPNVFAPGSSPSLDVTFTVTSEVTRPWQIGIGISGATVPPGLFIPAITDTGTGVITCNFPGGVSGTFTSLELAGLRPDTCYLSATTVGEIWTYFDVTFLDPRPSTGPITVVVHLDSGAITFPSTEGVYDYEAYSWDVDYVDRTVTSYTVANTNNAGSEIRHGQGLPMPSSGTCADVKDADYAWGTGLTGGWKKGWEPWVNASAAEGHRGGWACSRTLVNRGGNTWFIQ